MTDSVRMESAEAVDFGVLRITWKDGYEAVVDLRPLLAEGEMFAFLRQQPERFLDVRLADEGYSLFWIDPDGDEVDFGTDSLRRRAELHLAAE